MKLSEYIKMLEGVLAECGDLPVYRNDHSTAMMNAVVPTPIDQGLAAVGSVEHLKVPRGRERLTKVWSSIIDKPEDKGEGLVWVTR